MCGGGRREHFPHTHATSQQPSDRASSPALSPLSWLPSKHPCHHQLCTPWQINASPFPHTHTLGAGTPTPSTAGPAPLCCLGEAQGPPSHVLLLVRNRAGQLSRALQPVRDRASSGHPSSCRTKDVLMFSRAKMSHKINTDPSHCVAMDSNMALSDNLAWDFTMAPCGRAVYPQQATHLHP